MSEFSRGSHGFASHSVRCPPRSDRHEGPNPFGQQLNRVQHIVQDDRFVDVELKISLRSGESDRVIVAENLHSDHGQGFALRWFTLPGMIEEPGSFSRNLELGESCTRAAEQPTSERRSRSSSIRPPTCAAVPLMFHHRVMGRERRELISRGQRTACLFPRRFSSPRLPRIADRRSIPCQPASSSQCELIYPRQRRANRLQRLVELCRPPEMTWPSVKRRQRPGGESGRS